MKKLTSGSFALTTVMLILLLFAPLRAAAATVSGKGVTVRVNGDPHAGKEFTITVSFSADKEIGMVSASLSYSKNSIEFIGSDNAVSGGGGIITIEGSPQAGSSGMDIELHFRALSGGRSVVTVTNGTMLSPDGAVIAGSLSAEATVAATGETVLTDPPENTVTSVTEPPPPETSAETTAAPESLPEESSSSEADSSSQIPDDGGLARLKSLTVSEDKQSGEEKGDTFRLKPDFSPDVFEYEVTVHNDTEYISVDAELKDNLDTIWYDGSVYLPVGMTPWTITVTTPDAAVSHVYFIRVIRHEEGYVEESSSEESSSEESSSLAVLSSDHTSKPSNQAETPRIPSEADPNRRDERTFREKLMPVLIIAVCVITAAVLAIVIRIRMRSKNQFGQNGRN